MSSSESSGTIPRAVPRPGVRAPGRRFFLISMAALVGCGFTPAYGPNSAASALRGSVIVDAPTNRDTFDLVTQLERRFGQPVAPRYALSYNLSIREDGVGVTPEQEITRFNVLGQVTFSLRDTSSGAVLSSGSVDTFTGYTAGAIDVTASPPRTSSTISTLAAKRDAHARLMLTLADQIVARLIATSAGWVK